MTVAYDPEKWRKLDRLQNTIKLAGMTCHLINKAVVKQNCIEALNQHAQPLKKKAAFSNFTITIIIFFYYIYYYCDGPCDPQVAEDHSYTPILHMHRAVKIIIFTFFVTTV